MADRELFLRCDCSVEHLDIDIWLKPGIDGTPSGATIPAHLFEESYLTISTSFGTSSWKSRLKAIWEIIRGREYLLNSIILKPEDTEKLRDFCKELPSINR